MTYPSLPRTSALAIWSLVLGFLGIALCLPAIAGIICGIIALVRIGRSNGELRGNGWAISGLIMSIIGGFISSILLLAVVTPAFIRASGKLSENRTLAVERSDFRTTLVRKEKTGLFVLEPPAGELSIIKYRSPIGELPAYLSPIPNDGKKHPAIIWLTGGFSNSISPNAWEGAPPENDQTARVFRQLGVVTMYPSLRGGNDNPGYVESLYGEVDDVLAAADYLASQPGVGSIYLGGHSTGGTLALLVAETSPRFRAVFSFGPTARTVDYGSDSLTYDTSNFRENLLRSPIAWLHNIKSPTFVFEGEDEPGNIDSLRELKAKSKNPAIRFYSVKGRNHFSILAPYSRHVANQILAGSDPSNEFVFEDLMEGR